MFFWNTNRDLENATVQQPVYFQRSKCKKSVRKDRAFELFEDSVTFLHIIV